MKIFFCNITAENNQFLKQVNRLVPEYESDVSPTGKTPKIMFNDWYLKQ